MFINYDLKAIFFHNPKCAGNSMIDILQNCDFLEICRGYNENHENYINFVGDKRYIDKNVRHKHTIRKMGKYRYFYSHQSANKEHMDEFFKFTFVRNPYTKILSAYIYLKRRLENENNMISELEENPHYFKDFDVFVKNYQNVNNISFFHAFIPQYENLLDFSNNINFQYIGKTETFNEDLINIFILLNIKNYEELISGIHRKHNVSDYEKSITEYYNEETFQFVNTFFKKDFEVFGYKKYETFEEFKLNFTKDNNMFDIKNDKTILSDNLSNKIDGSNNNSEIINLLYFLYNNKNIYGFVNKYIEIINIVLNTENYYIPKNIRSIKNEINNLNKNFFEKENINNELLSKLINNLFESKKNVLLNNMKICHKCKFYNDLAYLAHNYFYK
jgi:hypothetical protein